ncbi:MAG: ABC transporter substrate-binding protein [Ideonella sp.]|nr:MAG: ABC transporter substrate-binding protein [Burkholderiaceae bacterium]MBE7418058.1 ABC transporter substrate-binding protein [Ideonella sp.]MBE7425096.1 ABC transporter substrate-binding protein [Ideonella sp.]
MSTPVSCLFASAALVAAIALPSDAAAQDILIGFQLPLTGSQSQYGETFRNSAQMQLDKLNAAGGVGGRKVQIVYEDSKSDPKEAVNIARKFVDDKRIVAVLGDFASGPSMAAGEVYGKEGVAQLSPTSSHPDFLKISNWQFRNVSTMVQEGPFIAKWLGETGSKSLAIIAVQNDWGLSATREVQKSFEAAGGKVTAMEAFNPGTRDFKAILTKVMQGKPEAIYLAVFYEEGALLLQQARQLNIQSKLFSTASLHHQKTLELAGPAAEGLFLVTVFMVDHPSKHVQQYVAEYRKRYSSDPTMFAAQAYDAVGIVIEALKRTGPEMTRPKVRDALADTSGYPGVTGTTTFDKATREPDKQLSRLHVENGKFVLLK